MTSENDSISGIVSDKEFTNEEDISKQTSDQSSVKDRARKRLKRQSEENTESEADLLQSAGDRDGTDTDEFGTDSSVRRKPKRARKAEVREIIKGYYDDMAEDDEDLDTDRNYTGELGLSTEDHDKYFESMLNKPSKRLEYFEKLGTEDPEEIGRFYETEQDISDDFDDAIDNRPLNLLPSLKDPKLFSVRCKGGSERETSISLMNKYLALKGTHDEINIFSASALDKFPGYIFVEAHRDFHVKDAIKGIKNLNINMVKIIPVKEVTQIFSPDPTKQPIFELGQFVRLKKGLYTGDLAMVVGFDDSFKRIKVKMVPRLMSGSFYDEYNGEVSKENVPGTKLRIPKRFFNPEEYPDAKSLKSDRGAGVSVYAYDNKRFENGMLVKTLWLKNLETENVVPTLEEVEMFRRAEVSKENREEIMNRAKKAIDESKKFVKHLEKGDKVQIIQGDLKGLTGVVTDVNEDHVRVLPDVDLMNEPVQYMPNELVKVFNNGDHVQILAGKYKGITGTIIKVSDNVAHIISEDNSEEMQVLLSDIKYSADVVVTQGSKKKTTSELQKHDMVIMNDKRTVGVITSILRDHIVLLDTDGFIQQFRKIQILNKLNPKGRVKNSQGHEIHAGCTVRVGEGAQKGTSAIVKQVYGSKLFLYDRHRMENSGLFVEHMNNCHFLGASNYDNTRMLARFNNPILKKHQEEQMSSMINPNDEKPLHNRRQDPKSHKVSMIGQVRTILKGHYKGHVGMIQSITETMARVELQARNKTIMVPLEHLNLGASEKETFFANTRMTGKTPMYRGANSPFYINTPAYNPE